jgi:membrane protein required for colicin V production
MPVTILDMIVIGVVLISALLAALRGFTREVLAIGSWAAAAVAAYVFHPQAIPLVQQYVTPNKSLHVPIAAGGIFLVTLLVAYFITSKLSDMILDSRIGALDRTLGFAFGAARGLLLAVVGFLFFSWLAQDERNHPTWVRDAKLKPILVSAGGTLKGFLPDNPEEALRKLRGKPPEGEAPREPVPEQPNQRRTEAPPPAPAAAAREGSPQDRAALQRMIEGGQRPAPTR